MALCNLRLPESETDHPKSPDPQYVGGPYQPRWVCNVEEQLAVFLWAVQKSVLEPVRAFFALLPDSSSLLCWGLLDHLIFFFSKSTALLFLVLTGLFPALFPLNSRKLHALLVGLTTFLMLVVVSF